MKKTNTLLLLTFIFTVIQIALLTFTLVTLAFNLFGIVDELNFIMQNTIGKDFDIYSMLTTYYIEFTIAIMVNLYACVLYYKGCKYKANNPNYARALMNNGIFQLLFSSIVPGILAIVTGIKMRNQKQQIVIAKPDSGVSEYKLTAMSEAVTRLKELKNSGAISEEEYYANLNKILEG